MLAQGGLKFFLREFNPHNSSPPPTTNQNQARRWTKRFFLGHGLGFLRGWRSWSISVYSGRPRHRPWTVKRTLNLLSFFHGLSFLGTVENYGKKKQKTRHTF